MQDLTKQHAFARLDVVRGLAALTVLAAHAHQVFFLRILGPGAPSSILSSALSRHAVLIFFLLSGNLITRSIMLNIRRNGQFAIGEYVASRFARIYPPLLGSIGICLMVWLAIKLFNLPGAVAYGQPGDLARVRDAYTIHVSDIFGALLMRGGLLEANGALWSLFVEVQTYALAMMIATLAAPNWLTRICAALIGVICLQLLRTQYFFVIIWFLGAATYFWVPPRIPALLSTLALGAAIIAVAVMQPALLGPQADTAAGQGVQFLCCLVYCLLLFALPPRLTYPPALIATGNFSYSLYIIHFPMLLLALSLCQDWAGHSLARTAAVFACAIIAIVSTAIPFARFFEQQDKVKRFLLGNARPFAPKQR